MWYTDVMVQSMFRAWTTGSALENVFSSHSSICQMLYAFQGIVYFLRHPALWKKVACPLVLTIVFGLATTYFMFSHTLPRQRDWLDDKDLPEELAEILAVCIVLTGMLVSTFVFGVVCIDYYLDVIFRVRLEGARLDQLIRRPRATFNGCVSLHFVLVVSLSSRSGFIASSLCPGHR
ncbi:hypothetical protein DVH05_028388 [Phytophthora capsici]|nr:hypothetical protein DVH05_028388 [Phytophthora capsici]